MRNQGYYNKNRAEFKHCYNCLGISLSGIYFTPQGMLHESLQFTARVPLAQ